MTTEQKPNLKHITYDIDPRIDWCMVGFVCMYYVLCICIISQTRKYILCGRLSVCIQSSNKLVKQSNMGTLAPTSPSHSPTPLPQHLAHHSPHQLCLLHRVLAAEKQAKAACAPSSHQDIVDLDARPLKENSQALLCNRLNCGIGCGRGVTLKLYIGSEQQETERADGSGIVDESVA